MAFAAMRMCRRTPMEVKDRRTVDSLSFERFPPARCHGRGHLTSRVPEREIDRQAIPTASSEQPLILDSGATVHHHRHPRLARPLGRFEVDYAQLSP
jgi:hypothetical protein